MGFLEIIPVSLIKKFLILKNLKIILLVQEEVYFIAAIIWFKNIIHKLQYLILNSLKIMLLVEELSFFTKMHTLF